MASESDKRNPNGYKTTMKKWKPNIRRILLRKSTLLKKSARRRNLRSKVKGEPTPASNNLICTMRGS